MTLTSICFTLAAVCAFVGVALGSSWLWLPIGGGMLVNAWLWSDSEDDDDA